MWTPWGQSDHQTTFIKQGITEVGTPSHGGLMVRQAWAKANLSLEAQALGTPCQNREGEWLAYEEDCAYAIPMYELTDAQIEMFMRRCLVANPERTVENYRANLHLSLSSNYPKYLMARGVAPEPTRYERFLKWEQQMAENDAQVKAMQELDAFVNANRVSVTGYLSEDARRG